MLQNKIKIDNLPLKQEAYNTVHDASSVLHTPLLQATNPVKYDGRRIRWIEDSS